MNKTFFKFHSFFFCVERTLLEELTMQKDWFTFQQVQGKFKQGWDVKEKNFEWGRGMIK